MRYAFGLLILLTLSCRTVKSNDSEQKITYGINIPESKFPSVVMLAMKAPEGTATCTGTFVSDTVVLTAAHCMIGLDAKNPELYYAVPRGAAIDKKVKALEFSMHPKASQDAVNQWDIAIVRFPAGTAPQISPIARRSVRAKDEVILVGYGNETFFPAKSAPDAGGGVKRYATNEVYSVKDGLIMIFGVPGRLPGMNRGEYGATAQGDSGGPLFKGAELAGVVSGGDVVTSDEGESEAISEFVDLASKDSQEFLRAHGL